jgi:polyisoprenoid-binding protein YceI
MATWEIDLSHSQINFTVRHMVFAKVHGSFKAWSAKLEIGDDLASSSVRAEIDVASIDTHEAKRDAHLRSGDFFDAEAHPKLTFQSKRVDKTGGGLKVIGDLTIRGTTKEVALDVEETGRGKDPWGQERVGFAGKTAIDRKDFGLTWNQALEAGGVLVGDKVEISIEVQAIKRG